MTDQANVLEEIRDLLQAISDKLDQPSRIVINSPSLGGQLGDAPRRATGCAACEKSGICGCVLGGPKITC